MEENKELIFEIICDNEDIIKRSINIYNQTYSTDFELVEYIYSMKWILLGLKGVYH